MSQEATWEGPWEVDGPWLHESGYPQTWLVRNKHYRTLCEAPTERGANLICDALNGLSDLAAAPGKQATGALTSPE